MKLGQTDQGFQDHNIVEDLNTQHIKLDDNEDNLERAEYNPNIKIDR